MFSFGRIWNNNIRWLIWRILSRANNWEGIFELICCQGWIFSRSLTIQGLLFDPISDKSLTSSVKKMDFSQKKKIVEDIFLWLWEAEERDDQSLSSFLVGERNGETREEYGEDDVTCCWSNQLLKVYSQAGPCQGPTFDCH